MQDKNEVIVPTMDDVKKAIEEHAESRNHPDATLQDKGFVVLSNDACSDSPTFSRFNLPGPALGDGVNYVAIRPRNIAFNYIVRAA